MVTRGLSERRALAVLCMSASAYRYQPAPDRNVALRERMMALAQRYKRYGAGQISLKLRQEGVFVTHKSVERMYSETKLPQTRATAERMTGRARQQPDATS